MPQRNDGFGIPIDESSTYRNFSEETRPYGIRYFHSHTYDAEAYFTYEEFGVIFRSYAKSYAKRIIISARSPSVFVCR